MTIFFYVYKRIITGQPRTRVRAEVQGRVVQIHRAGAALRPVVPVAT